MDLKVKGWWSRMGKSFNGPFLNGLVLKEDSRAEMRIQRIRNSMLECGAPLLSIHRARLFTNKYRESLSDAPPVRKAKAFSHVMELIPIPMVEEQLLMGYPSAIYNGVEIDPEYYTGWLFSEVPDRGVSQLRYLSKREKMRLECVERDIRELEEEILPYWRDRHAGALVFNDMDMLYPEAAHYVRNANVFMANFGKGFSHSIMDYASVVRKGLDGIKSEIRAEIRAVLSGIRSQEDILRLHHYNAMLICADAVILYARRCAGICEEQALLSSGERKNELIEMARICRKVPEYPAEQWWEALQAIYFVNMSTYLADGGVSHSFGRMDNYLYPFYKDYVDGDKEREAKAQELIECFFLKCYEYQSVRDEKTARGLSGDRTNTKITLGGIDEYGNDTVNALSYRFLEAHAHVHLKEPNLSVRLHRNTPEQFLMSVLEVIKLGGGLPQLLNDDVIVLALVTGANVKLGDARNYADIGCEENSIDPNSRPGADANGHNNSGFFNLVKVLELTMNNGVNPVNGLQVGPSTGEPDSLDNIEAFKKAFIEQLAYAVRMNVLMNYVVEYHFSKSFPNPYLNLMHPGPRKSGKDFVAGGCRYNWIGAVGVGLATLADSLMVVEELVYRTGKCSWTELLCALRDNWKGHKELRSQSLVLPRYGAEGNAAEAWARWAVKSFCDEYEKYSVLRGNENDHFTAGLFSMGIYLVLGDDVLATPDGRFAHEMLSGSVAPSRFAEPLGYTASHQAASSLDTLRLMNGLVFNQVVPVNIVSTGRDMGKWADLIRTYFDGGGMSVQYSVLDKDELRAAQKDPSQYKDLIVRIGGYSARFIDLVEEIQNEFIARLC